MTCVRTMIGLCLQWMMALTFAPSAHNTILRFCRHLGPAANNVRHRLAITKGIDIECAIMLAEISHHCRDVGGDFEIEAEKIGDRKITKLRAIPPGHEEAGDTRCLTCIAASQIDEARKRMRRGVASMAIVCMVTPHEVRKDAD
ncbi:hypothetical protein SAMN05518849_12830 [Sphingobium sp. AP50]|nr:hypothetical protein SAMN05518849_12830 [Sphingobium sp. AP50]